jgi:Major Facilitator Superfamily
VVLFRYGSTVIGAYMVEIAQAMSGSGRLTAVRQFVTQACFIVTGPTAGYLGSIAFGWTAAACGGVMFLLVPATILYLREQRVHIDSRELFEKAGQQLRNIATARAMWAAAGLMALFYLAPGLFTAVFYKQQNDLHLNTQGQGFLQLLSGVFGVIAALAYGYACRRLNLRTLLFVCLAAATAANLGYLFYSSVLRSQIVEGFNGLGYSLAELALMDLAVRATPAGSEGMGFSLMMSVRNLALFGTDWFGSKLLDQYHFTFNSLVLAPLPSSLFPSYCFSRRS